MKLLPFAFLLVLSSCASTPATPERNPLREQYEATIESIKAQADAALVPEESPFIAEDFLGGKLAETKKEVCEKKASCDEQVKEVLHARWQEKYKAVQLDSYKIYCKAHPKECRDLILSEKGLRQSHNQNVIKHRDNMLQQLYAQYMATLQARGQALLQHAQMLNATAPQPVQPVMSTPRVDLSCVQRCQTTGSPLEFCQSKCQY